MDLWAFAILLAIVFLLAGATYVFIYASQISQEDLTGEFNRRLEILSKEQNSTEKEQNSVEAVFTSLAKSIIDSCGSTTLPASSTSNSPRYLDDVDMIEKLSRADSIPGEVIISDKDIHLYNDCRIRLAGMVQSRRHNQPVRDYHQVTKKLDNLSNSREKVEDAMLQRLSGIYQQQDTNKPDSVVQAVSYLGLSLFKLT